MAATRMQVRPGGSGHFVRSLALAVNWRLMVAGCNDGVMLVSDLAELSGRVSTNKNNKKVLYRSARENLIDLHSRKAPSPENMILISPRGSAPAIDV